MAQRRPRGFGEVLQGRAQGTWAIRWRENGRRHFKGRLPSREVAEQLLAKVLGDIAQGLPAVPKLRTLAVIPAIREGDHPKDLPAPLDEIAHLLHEACFAMENVPGVYVLLRAGAVVYVGQSTAVRTRIGQHMGSIEFDRAVWIEFPRCALDVPERCLIAYLRPPLNRETYELTPQRADWLADYLGFRRPAA